MSMGWPFADEPVRLSAYLYEETNDPFYGQAAQLTMEFTINHMWNGRIFEDTIYPAMCQVKNVQLTLNQWFMEGERCDLPFMIETCILSTWLVGLSVWANVTKNDTLTSL